MRLEAGEHGVGGDRNQPGGGQGIGARADFDDRLRPDGEKARDAIFAGFLRRSMLIQEAAGQRVAPLGRA